MVIEVSGGERVDETSIEGIDILSILGKCSFPAMYSKTNSSGPLVKSNMLQTLKPEARLSDDEVLARESVLTSSVT